MHTNVETRRQQEEKILSILLHVFSGIEAGNEKEVPGRSKVAIIGAGRVGVSLAEELLNNSEAAYVPRCFIDINKEKLDEIYMAFRFGLKRKQLLRS